MTVLVEQFGDRRLTPPLTGAASARGGDGTRTEAVAAPEHTPSSSAPPRRPPSKPQPSTASPWRSTALRALGIVATLATLSAIGVWAIAAEPRGPRPPPPVVTDGTWFASEAGSAGPIEGAARCPKRDKSCTDGAASAGPSACSKGGAATRAPPATSGSAAGQQPEAPRLASDGRIVLNTADAQTLIRLPGVGPKRADAIVRLREKLGRFRRPAELLRIKGIGPKTLKKLLPLLVLDPPPEDSASRPE